MSKQILGGFEYHFQVDIFCGHVSLSNSSNKHMKTEIYNAELFSFKSLQELWNYVFLSVKHDLQNFAGNVLQVRLVVLDFIKEVWVAAKSHLLDVFGARDERVQAKKPFILRSQVLILYHLL